MIKKECELWSSFERKQNNFNHIIETDQLSIAKLKSYEPPLVKW